MEIPKGERKLTSLTIQEKFEIVQLIQNGSKQSQVSRLKNVSRSVVNRIWKNRENIEKQFHSGKGNAKKQKSSSYHDIESKLLQWIKSLTADKSIHVPVATIAQAANEFATELGYNDWNCSSSWITRFKKRHNIMIKKHKGKHSVPISTTIEEFENAEAGVVVKQEVDADAEFYDDDAEVDEPWSSTMPIPMQNEAIDPLEHEDGDQEIVSKMNFRVRKSESPSNDRRTRARAQGQANQAITSKIKHLLAEFCSIDSNCGICDKLILKLSQHLGSDHNHNHSQEYFDENEDSMTMPMDFLDEDKVHDHDLDLDLPNEDNEIAPVQTKRFRVRRRPTAEPRKKKAQAKKRCPLCARKFSFQSTLDEHLKSHSTFKPPISNLVLNEISDSSAWAEDPKKRIEADIMDKAFQMAGASNLDSIDIETIGHEAKDTKSKCISCTICNAKYFKIESLEKHYRDVHDPNKANFTCTECGAQFRHSRTLNTHFAQKHPTAHASYNCLICAKSFTQMKLLKFHVAAVHCTEEDRARQKPLLCPHPGCGHRFQFKGRLEGHMKRGHPPPGVNPFVCSTCGKICKSRRIHRAHEKIHSAVKSFMCELCGRCFGTKGELKRHDLVHTGEKSHVCDQCGKAFAQKCVLATHYKTHTGERPHQCQLCGKGFILPVGLRMHMKSHHGH